MKKRHNSYYVFCQSIHILRIWSSRFYLFHYSIHKMKNQAVALEKNDFIFGNLLSDERKNRIILQNRQHNFTLDAVFQNPIGRVCFCAPKSRGGSADAQGQAADSKQMRRAGVSERNII